MSSQTSDFLPGVLGQKRAALPDEVVCFILQAGEGCMAIGVPVAIDAKQEQVDHPPVSAQRLFDEFPFERLAGPVEPWVFADLDRRSRLADLLHHRLDDWLK
jgi:hypothetical protein